MPFDFNDIAAWGDRTPQAGGPFEGNHPAAGFGPGQGPGFLGPPVPAPHPGPAFQGPPAIHGGGGPAFQGPPTLWGNQGGHPYLGAQQWGNDFQMPNRGVFGDMGMDPSKQLLALLAFYFGKK